MRRLIVVAVVGLAACGGQGGDKLNLAAENPDALASIAWSTLDPETQVGLCLAPGAQVNYAVEDAMADEGLTDEQVTDVVAAVQRLMKRMCLR